jgi:protein dithiol oxidoreductase (disulfide-forming)
MESKQLSFFLFITLFICGLSINRVNAQEPDIQGPDISKSHTEVIFETSKGAFTLKLDPVKAPKTVANFLSYVDEGFYDGTIFHRVIADFVIQGGGFKSGMNYKKPHSPVKNESSNRLKNLTGTISMARRTHPDTATSQFYINLKHNASLDYKSDLQPGYTVFGNISKGMDVLERIAAVQTGTVDRYRDVPKEDITLISVKRAAGKVAKADGATVDATKQKKELYIEGEHYVVLDNPVATRDSSKVEVVEMFAYGCPHCYEFEPLVKGWEQQQGSDVDFWSFPAVWNEPMKLFAQAFYTAQELGVLDKIHHPLFTALVIEQKNIRNETDLANFFVLHGVDEKDFSMAFNSMAVESLVRQAEERVRSYKPAGAPEIIVNGKYRIDRMRAGGQAEMLAVVDFLVDKEREKLNNIK